MAKKKYDWNALRNTDAYKNLGDITWSANQQMAEKVTYAAYEQRQEEEAAQARQQAGAWRQAAKDKALNQISGVDNEYTKLFGNDDPAKYTKWNTGKPNTKPLTGFEKFSNQLFGVIGGIKNLKKPKKVWVTGGDGIQDPVSGEYKKTVWNQAMEIDAVAEDKNFYYTRSESGRITAFKKNNCTDKKPSVESIDKAYKQASIENSKKRATTFDKFAYNVSQGVQSVAFGSKDKGFVPTGNKALDVASNVGGQLLGFAAPSGAGNSLFSGATKISEGAIAKGGQLLTKYGGNVGSKVASKVVSGAGKSAAIGALDMGQFSFMNEEAPTAKEVVSNMVIGGVTGGVLGKGAEVIGNKWSKLKLSRQQVLNGHIIPDDKITSEIVKKRSIVSKSKYESALDYHNAKYDEYKAAEAAWEDAVNSIQNKFGQKELTGAEQSAIKSEMGIEIEKLADKYDNAYNEYLKSKDALGKSIDRQSLANKKIPEKQGLAGDLNQANKPSNTQNQVSKKDFNKKYGLDQDISKLSRIEQKEAYKKSLSNILEDSGASISKRLNTDNPYDVVKFYEDKYKLGPIKVVKSNTTNTTPAKIFINKNKAGEVISARLELNEAFSKNQQLGALRHEIEHYKDVASGFKGTKNIDTLKQVNTLEDLYNQSYKGHHKDYGSFDLEYLQNSLNKETTGSTSLAGQKGDIKLQQPNSKDQYNIGYENDPLNMPNVNKKFKPKNVETSSQHMTDTKGNKNLKTQIAKAKDYFNRLVTDRYTDVSKISKQANELLNLESQSNGTVEYILNKGVVDKTGKPLTNKSFKDVLSMQNKTTQKHYEDYLLNKHNIDRFREKKTLLVDEAGNKITPEQSKAFVERYEQEYPEFKELSNQYTSNWNSFTNEWLSDFVSKDTMKTLQQKYPSYVPSHRQLESFSSPIPTNRVVSGVKIHEATGSSKKIIPLNEQITAQVNKIVKANRRNEAYKEMLKPILENPEAFKSKIEIVKIGTNKYANETEREIAQQVLSMQDNIIAGEDSINSLIDVINNPVKQMPGRDGYLTIFDKGTPITVKIKDQNLFNALNKSVRTDELSTLAKAWNKYVLTPFKGAITRYNPFFAVRNTIRDTQSAYVQGIENNPLKFAGQRFKSVFDIIKKDPVWKQYEALGGEMSSISANPLKPSKMGKVGKGLKAIPKKYSDALGISEQFNRFAEFKKVLKETGDVNKARIAAANVTVNFGKGGTLLKLIDKVIPYSNAAVQGLVKSAETFKNKPVQAISKAVVSSTIPAALFYGYNNMDKSRQKVYDEIPNDVKNTNYILVMDKNNIIKLPKNHQVGLLFGSLGERIFDYYAKNDKEAFQGMPDTLKKTFIPVDLKSGVVMPAVNMLLGGNKDYFGREIVPRSMEKMSPGKQFDENTTSLAKFIGTQFDLSPKKVDYLLDSYTGVIYDLMKKSEGGGSILEKGMQGVTGTTKANFMVNADYTRSTDKYYELVDRIQKEKADFDKSIADKKEEVQRRGFSLQSKAGKEVLDSLLGKDATKYAKLKELSNTINDQFTETRGFSAKQRKKKLTEYLRQLENLTK